MIIIVTNGPEEVVVAADEDGQRHNGRTRQRKHHIPVELPLRRAVDFDRFVDGSTSSTAIRVRTTLREISLVKPSQNLEFVSCMIA